ncbi:MAG: alanine--tRNA ligase [candidate division WOR-3 bacterium]|nr:alanine--tRNA ligase [candidate division WOR-3 bacterium]
MNNLEIRESFLNFFKEKGHTIVPSMSLIPRDDPSLLFTSAGMVQFKPLWTGTVPLPYKRAASIQKCLRLSDLDNVGKTRRHHTFFEMLGNFSFGDYFKKEAILWAWEYLTRVLKIDKTRLYVSVHHEDIDAYNIWREEVGLAPERIYRLGDETNFWGPAGDSGPCGPCSEIYFDLGEKFSCGNKTCSPGCDCDRYIEVWNLVFPQFDQKVTGERLPLKNRGVDTGMGLERLASIVQKKESNFHTDLFYPIIENIEELTGKKYGKETSVDININTIADHIRALVFAIGDGIIPSNEERGYVLRRILRRATRLNLNFGINEPLLYKLVPAVVELYKSSYPELVEHREEITLVIKSEEERFLATLEKGMALFEEIARKKKRISGDEAFKLYDTYGFPIELTLEIAREKGMEVDEAGFHKNLETAREESRAKAKFMLSGDWKVLKEGAGRFVGYENNEVETEILRYNESGKNVEVVLADSPFYAEAGGQVGETGWIIGRDFRLKVLDTYWLQGMNTCHCEIENGRFKPEKVLARVDMKHRKESARAHTTTHLLHAALRKILGEHARQEGSFVAPGRFRFDFMHFKPLSEDEIRAIEEMVNEKIMEAIPVEKFWTTLEEAKRMGAVALFGEKYGKEVRVVKIKDFSIELCGGIHLDNTGEVGLFKIISQEAASAGIRRIEGLVGFSLLDELRQYRNILKNITEFLGSDKNIVEKIEEIQHRLKNLENINQKQQTKLAWFVASQIMEEMKDEHWIVKRIEGFDNEGMRLVADFIRDKAKDRLGVLYDIVNNRVNYLVFVGDELKQKFPAQNLIKSVSKIIGGGGGGRQHLAEGGGGKPEKIPELIEYFKKNIVF